MNYPLASDSWDEEEVAAIQAVIASGRYTYGPRIEAFEAAFAERFGSRHAVMVNSGSSANLAAVAALCFKKERPLERGDEVIVPAISWSTTYFPLQQYGLKLKFVDVDPETLNMDMAQLEAALSDKTRMVVAVSILGNPCELDKMRALCDARGIYLFEDNCESMGATLNGKECGTFGEVGTFSFFFSHHISTIEGGMVLTDDLELCHLMKAIRSHGWTRGLPKDSPIFESRGDDFFEAYRFIVPGYNLRSTEINAAIGLAQLKKLDKMLEVRRANAHHFQETVAKLPGLITPRENGCSSWFSFPMILKPELEIERQTVLEALKAADIEHRIITGGNFLRHDAIKFFDYTCHGEMHNANLAHDRGFFVGNSPTDLRPQLDNLHQVLSQVLGVSQ
ncbi:MAG: DegT/DnrJ/EryC1/StrS family aminotransferase [Candidatus Sericytochromatia bacterium]